MNKKLLILFLIWGIYLAPTIRGADTLYCIEDFETDTSANWSVSADSAISVASGAFILDPPESGNIYGTTWNDNCALNLTLSYDFYAEWASNGATDGTSFHEGLFIDSSNFINANIGYVARAGESALFGYKQGILVNASAVATGSAVTITSMSWYRSRFRYNATSGTCFFKVWSNASAEPADWTLNTTGCATPSQTSIGFGHRKNIMYVNYYNITALATAAPPPPPGAVNVNAQSPTDPYTTNNPFNQINFTYNVSGGFTAYDCELWSNVTGTYSKTKESYNILNNTQTIINNQSITDFNGTLIWSIRCTDNATPDMSGSTGGASANATLSIDLQSPAATFGSNNLWQTNTTPTYNKDQAQNSTINFTITDDRDVYGYELLITRESDNFEILNITNTSASGTEVNVLFTKNLYNVSENYNIFNVSLTVWDSHTKQNIPQVSIKKGANFIEFDQILKVSAPGALSSATSQKFDRVEFGFNFPGEGDKTFYVESINNLDPVTTSGYKGHFVDWAAKRWIDFEGISGSPEVEKISDKKYKLTFRNAPRELQFKSTGFLNNNSYFESYAVVAAPTVSWYTAPSGSLYPNGTLSVALNVSTYGLGNVFFRIFNASGVIDTVNATGTLSGIYNATFTGLSTGDYSYNATVTDNVSNVVHSSVINVQFFKIDNCSEGSIVVANLLVSDEETPTKKLINDMEITGRYWLQSATIARNYSFGFNSKTNYSICLVTNGTAAFRMDIYAKYTTTNGFTHRYYVYNGSFVNSSAVQYFLYNFNDSTIPSDLRMTSRYESNYNPFKNVVTSLLRFYPAEGIWRTVQMDESGDFGLLFFNIREEDTDYKFLFRDRQNHLLDSTDSMKFACTDGVCDLTMLLNPYSGTTVSTNLSVTYTYNNNTGNLTVTFNDPLGITTSLRAEVTKETMTGTAVLCNHTALGSSGSFNCELSGYTGEVFVRIFSTASPETSFISEWIKLSKGALSLLIPKQEGALWSFAIMATVVMVGVFSPAAAVILAVLSLIIIYMLGIFSAISLTVVIIGVVLGVAIGFKVRN